MAEKCKHIKPDGSQCGNWSQRTGDYCFWHDPEIPDAEKTAARSKGGERARYQNLPPTNLQQEDKVIPVLARAVEQLEQMQVSPQTMATLGNVASALDRAIGRREARGADVTLIEVEYVNDWRKD